MGARNIGCSSRFVAGATDRLLRVILRLRGGELFKEQSSEFCSQAQKFFVLNH
jgi:hypothetical protein